MSKPKKRKKAPVKETRYKQGSIFLNKHVDIFSGKTIMQELMLVQISRGMFMLIDLQGGNRWSDHPMAGCPIEGFTIEDIHRMAGTTNFKYKRRHL